MSIYWKVMVVIIFSVSLVIPLGAQDSITILDNQKAKAKIDAMLISRDYSYQIIKISELVNDVCAVAIQPPYREFPNVVLFYYDRVNREYVRIYEGLCLGIQDEPSGKTDLHTKGLGIDMEIDGGIKSFMDDKVQKVIKAGNAATLIVIPYHNFFHSHGSSSESYTIDKTRFYDFALKLIGSVYKEYPSDSCIMFDIPDLEDMQLSYENGKYIIKGVTKNNQIWKVSFDRVDENKRYLVNKKIEVSIK